MKRVLVVDDNPTHLRITSKIAQKILGEKGRIESFSDPMEFIHAAQFGAKPDLIVIDYMMPAMDGLTALRILRNKGINSKAMIVSAYLTDLYSKLIESNNISVVIKKPFSINEIGDEMAVALGMVPGTLVGVERGDDK